MSKAVAITGGARGIGATTARAFAAKGHRVAIGDIDAALVDKTAAEIAMAVGAKPPHPRPGEIPRTPQKTGATVIGLPVDVTDAASFEEFLSIAEERLDGLDVLVNNAGIMPTGEFLDEPMEVADRQFAINVRGVIIGSKLAGNRFAARGHGHLVNIASVAGLVASPGVATYCATKHAVVGLGTALHQELAPKGVHVSTICPSFVNTELISGLAPNWLTRKIGYVQPEDVAAVIVDVVERGRGGQRVVPRRGGVAAKLLVPLPEELRNRLSHLLGAHNVITKADTAQRAAYLDRAEHEAPR